jgi:hypothetical protein
LNYTFYHNNVWISITKSESIHILYYNNVRNLYYRNSETLRQVTILVPRNQTSPFLKALKNSVLIVLSKNTILACMGVYCLWFTAMHTLSQMDITSVNNCTFIKVYFQSQSLKFHFVIITCAFLIQIYSVFK